MPIDNKELACTAGSLEKWCTCRETQAKVRDMTNVTTKTGAQLVEQLEADGILTIQHVKDPCTACGADLNDEHGGHYRGCGNAGRYDDEPPVRPTPWIDWEPRENRYDLDEFELHDGEA